MKIVAAVFPGAALGAWVGVRLDGDLFRWVLAGVMVLAWLWMAAGWLRAAARRTKGSSEAKVASASEGPAGARPQVSQAGAKPWIVYGALILVGFYGGFLQAGVGFLIMAVLHRLAGFDLVSTNAHKVLMVFAYTPVALSVFAFGGNVRWEAGVCLAVGTGIGGFIGARETLKRGAPFVRVVFSVALVALVIKLLAFS